MLCTLFNSVFSCLPPCIGLLQQPCCYCFVCIYGCSHHSLRSIYNPASSSCLLFLLCTGTSFHGYAGRHSMDLASSLGFEGEYRQLHILKLGSSYPDYSPPLWPWLVWPAGCQGVGYKQGDMMATILKPGPSFHMFLFLPEICFPRSWPLDWPPPLLLYFHHLVKSFNTWLYNF